MAMARHAAAPAHSELAARVAAIGWRAEHAGLEELRREVAAIRALAAQHGIGPAVTVSNALAEALARGDDGPLIRGWIDALHRALDCAPPGPQ